MSALFPDEVRNQQAANALLNRHRLGSFTLGIPIAQLQVVEGTRPVDESYVQELQSYMDGRIDHKRWPCRVVFLLRSSVPISLEAGQRLFETLRRANKAAIRRGDLNWLYDEFEVRLADGQHRAFALRGMNLSDLEWACECYFETILDDTPAKFELLHGHHSRPVTLPTTVTMFCHQLREVLTKIALDHPNEPRYLLNIDPQGAEFAACFQALDGWNPRTDSLPKTKVALVLLFITSPSLGALLIQMSVYEDWEESIGSLRLLRDWTARGMGDVTAAAISIVKKPWDVFFGAAPHLLTPLVAHRLEGRPVPTNAHEVHAMRTLLESEMSEHDWAPISNAWLLHEDELIAAALESPLFVGPRHLVQTLGLDKLAQHFLIPLAISMDEENKKNYLRGSGTRGRFTKPWTVALLDKLWEVDRTVGVAKGLYPRGDVNEDIQAMLVRLIGLRGAIRHELDHQEPYEALDANWFRPGPSNVVPLIMHLVRWSVPLATLLPHAQIPSRAQPH